MIHRMKNRVLLAAFAIPTLAITLAAQRPADAPATMTAAKPPDTVLIEELTWAEVRDLVAAGTTNVIIGTAGTEQKGPHMVDGEHKFIMEYAADKIARGMGKTLVAPVITYVPEGSWDPPSGHMRYPGTITLPEDRFIELLVMAGRSLKASGFKNIYFLGESGGNRNGMRTAATRLNELWKGAATAHWVDDYYTKSHADQNKWITANMKIPGGSDRRARQPARHLGAAVRRAEAHSPRSPDRQRLSEQRRQRRPGEVNGGDRQGVPADQDRQHAGADQKNVERRRAARGRAASAGWRRWWPWRCGSSAECAGAANRSDHDDRAGEQDADQGARHRVRRRADVGREPRRDEGRQDRVHRARSAAPRRTAITWCSASITTR